MSGKPRASRRGIQRLQGETRSDARLARTRGDPTSYHDYRDRYRDMAKTLGFEGHITWGEAMP